MEPPCEWLVTIGTALCIAPSYVVFRLDDFFASWDQWRYPVAGLLVAVEVFLLCLVTYRIVANRKKVSGTAP